jgi:hypothetical protein
MDNVHQNQIEKRNVSAEQQHRDNHHHGRITQFFVSPESFLLRIPRPRAFLQLDLHFAEEVFDFGNHQFSKETSNIQRSTSNAQLSFSGFEVQCSTLGVRRLQSFFARQEGLEPPTDGFGDRYSTN